MTKIFIKHVDTFTTVPQTGNPAGVVLDAQGLSDAQMLSLAREINLNETAFIFAPETPDAHIRIRWFTPAGEIIMSGHATLAAMHVLAEENQLGMTKDGEYKFLVETIKNTIPVIINKRKKSITTTLYLDIPDFERATQYKVDLIRLLNINVSEFDPSLTVQRNGFLFAPLRRLHTLFTMKPNIEALSSFLAKRDFDGLCVFTTETVDRNSLIHSRVFAPHVGIPEDPVTGFTHRSLAIFLQEKKLIPSKDGRFIFQAEQGDVLGRKGRLNVEIIMENNQPQKVAITGSAVTVLEGELLLQN